MYTKWVKWTKFIDTETHIHINILVITVNINGLNFLSEYRNYQIEILKNL